LFVSPAVDTALLRRNSLFAVLNDAEMEAMLELGKVRRAVAEERIFTKGDPGDSLYAILRGRVAVQTESDEAKVMLLNILDAGALFGEIAMLDGGERTATVVAQEPTELLRIDRRDFMPFLSQRADLCIRLMAVLCERVRWTSAIIEDTVFLNVPRRLAKRILMLAQSYGRTTDTGTRITAFVSQEDLANMLGVSRESVNKTLKSFQAAGAITYRNGFIVVQDESFLDQVAR
jgi:CRP-like cAMP-binding protein